MQRRGEDEWRHIDIHIIWHTLCQCVCCCVFISCSCIIFVLSCILSCTCMLLIIYYTFRLKLKKLWLCVCACVRVCLIWCVHIIRYILWKYGNRIPNLAPRDWNYAIEKICRMTHTIIRHYRVQWPSPWVLVSRLWLVNSLLCTRSDDFNIRYIRIKRIFCSIPMQYDDSYGWEKLSHAVYLWDFPACHTSVPKIDIMGFFEIIWLTYDRIPNHCKY